MSPVSPVTTAALKSAAEMNMELGSEAREMRERSERDPGKRLIKQLHDCESQQAVAAKS